MSALRAIAWREFASYFRSSIGWVVIALFLVLSGGFVAIAALRPGEPASLRTFFAVSQWILLIVAPAISMRLLADELRTGTMEVLLTSPVTDWQTIVGKYAGGVLVLLAMLAPTLLYVALLELVSDPDPGPIVTGYLALVLVGMLYLAFGTLCSALTENQVVAMLGTFFFFLLLELGASQGGRLAPPPLDKVLFSFSILLRVGDLAKGVIDLGHVVFFLSASVWCLVLAVTSVESRRWR